MLAAAVLGAAMGVAWADSVAPSGRPQWIEGYRVRYMLRVVLDPYDQPARTVIAQIPSGWVGTDAAGGPGCVIVQSESGRIMPTLVVSYDPDADTLIRFPRCGDEQWYWAYVMPKPGTMPPVLQGPEAEQAVTDLLLAREGLTVEMRRWDGDNPPDWKTVAEALQQFGAQRVGGGKGEAMPEIVGSAALSQIATSGSPSRPDVSNRFIAFYRGYLKVDTSGKYKIFVNSHGASFLFLDGKMVFQRPGQNVQVGRIGKDGLELALEAGVHLLRLYQVVGTNTESYAACILNWMPPGKDKYETVPREAFAPAMFATATDVECAGGGQAADFVYGIDDVLKLERMELYLVRFEAAGRITDPDKLAWDLGDGTTARGRTVWHLYSAEGTYEVKLKSADDLPAFRRPAFVWPAPVPTSPHSLATAVRIISQQNIETLAPARLNEFFGFLLICEQPSRWPVLERVARLLLGQKNLDAETRVQASTALWESMAAQGRAAEAAQLGDKAMEEFAKFPPLRARLMLAIGDIYRDYLRDANKAQQYYSRLVDEHRRLNDPVVREAAIRMGDTFTDTGDIEQARKAYRLAATVGGSGFDTSAQEDAVAQGTMLRLAEQSLKNGNIRETRRLLQQIELKFPEQRLGGLCRLMRAETERQSGRYDQAIRNYELLMNLLNWAGFRDQALFGIADCYSRKADFDQALKWLELLRQSFPKFYEDRKLSDYEHALAARKEQAAKDGPDAARTPASFAIDFERQNDLEAAQCQFIPAMGIDGPTAAFFESPAPNMFRLTLDRNRLSRARAGDRYWVEFWYKDMVPSRSLQSGNATSANVMYYRPGTQTGTTLLRPEFGYGQWRKTGTIVQVPFDNGCLQEFEFTVAGLLEIDGLRMLPMSDLQYDTMLNFTEEEKDEE